MLMSPGCKCCQQSQATVTGTIKACAGINFAGAVVTFAPTGGGTPYGTLTTNASGVYNGQVPIPSTPVQAVVTAAPGPNDPYAARFGATTPVTVSLVANQGTSVATITVPAATGYHCCTGLYYGLPESLHLTDTLNGPFTLAWSAALGGWEAKPKLNYGGCARNGCPAASNVPCIYRFTCTAIQFLWGVAAGTVCPDPSNFSTSGGPVNVTPTTTNPFTITVSVAGNPTQDTWYCGQDASWTLTE